MKKKLLHFFAVFVAMAIAIPVANAAADYNYSSPTKAWAHSETTYSSRYYSIAVSEDNIFTLPSVSSTGTGMYSTYYTKGLRFSSSGVVAFSGGSGSYAFPNGSSGSYYYLGPATASDSKGTFIAATRRAGAPNGFGWASNVQSVAYYTSNPSSADLNHTSPVAGSKEPINFSSTPISGRTDKMSAYGDVANGTGYLWFIPGNANNSYVGVERITTTSSGTVTSKRQWPFPSAITNIDNNTSRIMQYSNNCVLLDVHNKNFFKGIISNDHETITWTDLGIKASEGTGAAMFILGNHEILAYTSSSTQVTLYDVTDKKTISTFSPFSSASSVSSTRHAIDVRVSGNTANIYVLVPGQGAGKWTMTATPITSAVTSPKAALASGSTSVVNVTWGKPSQGTATKYAISYSSDGGSTWSTAVETTNLSYTFNNLETGTYKFKVTPYFGGSSTWGPESIAPESIEVITAVGASISNLAYKYVKNTVTDIGRQDITLTWDAPTGMVNTTVTGYKVYRNGSLLATLGADVTSYTNAGITQNYTYKVVPLFANLGENASFGQEVTTTEVQAGVLVAPVITETRNYEGYSLVEVFYSMPGYAPYKPLYWNLYRDGKLIQAKLQSYNTLDESLVRSSVETTVNYQVEAVYGSAADVYPPIDSVKSNITTLTIAPRDWAKTGYILQEIYNVPITDIAADKKPNLFDNNEYYRQGHFYNGSWYIAQRADNLSKKDDPSYTASDKSTEIVSGVAGTTGGVVSIKAIEENDVLTGFTGKPITSEAFASVGLAMDDAGNIFMRYNNDSNADMATTAPAIDKITGLPVSWLTWVADGFTRRITRGAIYKRNADGTYETTPIVLNLNTLWTSNDWINTMAFTYQDSSAGDKNGQVTGRSDYYSMYGDVMSAEGGYLILSPSWTRTAFKVKIANGAYVSHEIVEFNRYENTGYLLEPKTGTENYGFHLDGRDDVTVQIRSNGYYGVHEWSEAGTTGWHPIYTADSRINNAGGTSIQAFGEIDGTGRHTGELFIITPQSMHSHNVGDFLVSRATKASGDDYADEGSLMPSTPVAQYVQTDERSNSTATNANGNWFHAEKGTYASAMKDDDECVDIYQYVPGTRFARYRLIPSNQFPPVQPTLDITTAYNDDKTDITHFDGVATWQRPAGFGRSTGSVNAKVMSYLFEMYNSKNELVASTELPEVTKEDGSPIDDTYEYKFDYTAETGKDDIDFGRYSVNVQVKYETKDGVEHLSEPSFAEASHDYVAEEASDRHIWMYKNANVTEDVWEYDEDKKDWVTVKKAFDNYRIELDFNAPTGTDEPVSYYTIHAYVNNKKDFIQISDFHLHKGAETVNGVTQAILDRDEKGNVIPTSQVPGTYIFDGENSWKAPFYKVGDNYEEVVGGQSRQTSVLTWHHKVPAGYYTSGVATTAEGDDITITDEPNNWKFVVVAHYAANNRSIAKSEEAQFSPELYDFITTGVEVVGDNTATLKIYPIPATTSITVKAPEAINSIVIYNEAGVEVMSEMGDGDNMLDVNIEHLATGFYFVKVNNYAPVKIIKK